jgi:DNA (cytosine-5)-methyltransferase 1
MTENQKTAIPGRLESFVTHFRHLDLFSGIGGFSLAAAWAYGKEHEIVGFCEINPYCHEVLKKHWPNVPIFEDIRSLDGKQFGAVDLITGGFPCQPFSTSGKLLGKEDDRYLWPEMLRVISEAKPRWIVSENVANLINMELGEMLFDLEAIGYEIAPPLVIPACAVNAHHRRDRVWIIAHADAVRCTERPLDRQRIQRQNETCPETVSSIGRTAFAHAECQRLSSGFQQRRGPTAILFAPDAGPGDELGHWQAWDGEPDLADLVHGLPEELDGSEALGNAIVPQVAFELMKAIKAIDKGEGNGTEDV